LAFEVNESMVESGDRSCGTAIAFLTNEGKFMNNNDVISIINNLIESCRKGQTLFKSAGECVQNHEFRRLFNIFSQQRAQFMTELQAEAHRLGGTVNSSSSMKGAETRA